MKNNRCGPCGAPKNGGFKCEYCQTEYHSNSTRDMYLHAYHNQYYASRNEMEAQQRGIFGSPLGALLTGLF